MLFITASDSKNFFILAKTTKKKRNVFTHLAYSCGKGLEYQVSISYCPNSIAAGQRSCDTIAIEPGLSFVGEDNAKLTLAPGFIISATAFAALSRTSLYKSASSFVTPSGNGGFSILINGIKKIKEKYFI